MKLRPKSILFDIVNEPVMPKHKIRVIDNIYSSEIITDLGVDESVPNLSGFQHVPAQNHPRSFIKLYVGPACQ